MHAYRQAPAGHSTRGVLEASPGHREPADPRESLRGDREVPTEIPRRAPSQRWRLQRGNACASRVPREEGKLKEGSQVEPTNDDELTLQWFHNGAPLGSGHRFRTTHDFGYVSLDILHAVSEDAGEWKVVATNPQGQAETSTTLQVRIKPERAFRWRRI